MPQAIYTHQLDNGLILLAERMDWLESAAFTLLMPAGCCREPPDRGGLASLVCEMAQRGSGSRNSRQVVEDLENLGVDHSAAVSNAHTSFGGAMPAENLAAALAIYADQVRSPHLPAGQLEESREACIQEVRSLEDDLAQQVMIDLRRRLYPDPFGRNATGTLAALTAVGLPEVRAFWETYYRPNGAILSVAGKVDWPQLRDDVTRLFGCWPSRPRPELDEMLPAHRYHHLPHESNQTHIAVGFPSVPYGDSQYYQARGAVGILSDGMSSRLFTEIREKRGLCYTVYASCHSLRDRGSVVSYAGTTTERAQETLDVLLAELARLAAGVAQDELDRLKARIKSALIMQQESSGSRASSMAADWYFLRRVQTMDEIRRLIDGLSCASINAYLAANPPQDFRIVTLGEKKLEVPVGVS